VTLQRLSAYHTLDLYVPTYFASLAVSFLHSVPPLAFGHSSAFLSIFQTSCGTNLSVFSSFPFNFRFLCTPLFFSQTLSNYHPFSLGQRRQAMKAHATADAHVETQHTRTRSRRPARTAADSMTIGPVMRRKWKVEQDEVQQQRGRRRNMQIALRRAAGTRTGPLHTALGEAGAGTSPSPARRAGRGDIASKKDRGVFFFGGSREDIDREAGRSRCGCWSGPLVRATSAT